ncbi:FAD-binding oxidoreductase [Pseudohoeflea suaedae]|uniref:FAD-binding oxidoreductase n=1 Tax=Pseudohoeflea suaedae TaxID=877384 RepID=A0A4R5PPJ5_9HYPH|nr:FAD-binding oxidoreductase [Pseudohoeflea suaedae]TDH38537.1 FAD-binding oxidoreductase [Pseudohoeflea suaedae]
MIQTSDFLVIGGGIAGISAAAFLSETARVTVLETETTPGYHATGRTAAIYIRNYGNATLRALNANAHGFLEQPEGVSETSLLSPRGELMIATEDELPTFDAYVAGASGMDRLTAAEAVELFPILRPEPIAAAAIERDAMDIDVDRFLQGLIRLLRQRGGNIVTGAPAGALMRKDGLWTAETPQGRFSAPVVINAAGAWADQIARLGGAKPLSITPMRRSAALLPAPDGYAIDSWPLVASASERWYAKPEAGKMMVSPADETPVEAHDAWADEMDLAEGLFRFEQAVTTPVTRVETSWAGLRSFAPDRTPVCGFDAEREGFFWLAGQGGYGIQTAPALARLTVQLCRGEKTDLNATTIAALDPSRFGDA